MAIDPITMLLMVRESYAQQRRDLIRENCDLDVVSGRPILITFRKEALDALLEIDRWLTELDATLIEAGAEAQAPAEPEPISDNVIRFPARVRPAVVCGGAA